MMTRWHSQIGQGLVEYGFLLAALTVAVMLVLTALGINLRDNYCQTARGVGADNAPGCSQPQSPADAQEWKDDFSGGAGGGWTFDGKKGWATKEGQMCGAVGDDSRTTRMFAANSYGEDYTITANATLEKGNGYGIYFRASGSSAPPNGNTFQNGYTFQYDPGLGRFVFRKWINGKVLNPPLASVSPPKGFKWTDVKREIKLDIRGNTFVASIDGKPILSASDNSFRSGYVGLRIWDNTRACFDDVAVKWNK